MAKQIKSIVALVAIVAVMGLLLAITNAVTAPVIEKNQSAAANEALLVVMPEGTGFESVDLAGQDLPGTVVEAYRETGGLGYVFKLNATGWKPDMILMCGVTADGTVTGATCLSSSETWDYVNTLGPQMAGKTADTLADVEAGATSLSVKGYKSAVKDAIDAAVILGGGSVDRRTEEEILQDNLKATLPEGDTFQKWFEAEALDGVDAVYVADNGAGYVCVIGEEMVGVGRDGQSDNPAAAAAAATVRDCVLTDLDFSKTGVNENIQKIQKTASGNYVIEINGLGYAWFDDNHGYGEQRFVPIVIKVSLTADGTIIDCLTVSHEESRGYGETCGTEAYYTQFDGKTAATYTEVDAIAGATMTTNGYMKAIQRCFEAVEILEGGAQ